MRDQMTSSISLAAISGCITAALSRWCQTCHGNDSRDKNVHILRVFDNADELFDHVISSNQVFIIKHIDLSDEKLTTDLECGIYCNVKLSQMLNVARD